MATVDTIAAAHPELEALGYQATWCQIASLRKERVTQAGRVQDLTDKLGKIACAVAST